MSTSIYGCHFFLMDEFDYTPLLHMLFQVRYYFVRLPLCHLSSSNIGGILVGRFSFNCHPTHNPSYIVGQHNIVGDFFFSEQPFVNRCTFQNHLLLHSFMHLAICNHFFIYLFFFYFFFSLLFLLFSNQFKRNLAANSKNILVIYMGIVSQKKAF